MGKKHKLVIAFHRKEDLIAFVRENLPENVRVYHGDALDAEFNGVVPANSYVLRNAGSKPDKFLADYTYIGEGTS